MGPQVLADYFLIALYLGFLTLRSGGLEHAVGLHLANNIYAFSIVNYAAGDWPIPSVFFDPSAEYSGENSLYLAGVLVTHYVILSLWEWAGRRLKPSTE